jgi:hypothetical protein
MKLADPRIPRRPSLRTVRRTGVFALSGALLSAAALALSGCSAAGSGDNVALAAANTSMQQSLAGSYQIVTRDNDRDVTFNQLLGINNEGVIAGYFGSGAAGHPNKGYVLLPPFAQRDYLNENYPGSVQTQVTALNDAGVTVGFWANKSGANFGFYESGDRFRNVNFPTKNNAKPAVNQLLGINNTGTAVGFYNDSAGNAHGYVYNIKSRKFVLVKVSGATSLTAAAINNHGAVAGFYTDKAGTTDGFLQLHGGKTITIAFPGASMTQIFGLNDSDEVAGAYTTGTGSAAVTHGFVWLNGKFGTVDVPAGTGGTTVNGINNEGDLVGFYTDAAGNTDGFLALP